MKALRLALLLLAVACRGGPTPGSDPERQEPASVARLQALHAAAPENPLIRYNLGTLLLREGRFDEAREHLRAAAASGDAALRQAAHFNRGNTDLEPAFARRSEGVDREALTRAIDEYRRALLLKPSDGDAKWNLELARRLLDRQPQSPPPQGGGGGGSGGGGDDRNPGQRDPDPQPSGEGGPQPPLTPAEADRILSSARQREVELQREKLRKQQPRSTSAH